MPKQNVDYSKSLIYKIEHLDKPELVYIGSTSNFVKRKANHKKCCNNENSKAYNQLKYRTMRENGGWEQFKMVVIKEYSCNTRTELDIEEEKCRKELQASLNSHRCHITEEENRETIAEYGKNYRSNNKEVIAENGKNYRSNNKEVIAENRSNNKEVIAEKAKEKITCACGSTFRISGKSKHERTNKHCEFIFKQLS